MHSGRFS